MALTNGPNDFITRLIKKYNDPTLSRAPDHPFDRDLSTDEHTSQLTIAGREGFFQIPVFNFAVARVRYRGTTWDAEVMGSDAIALNAHLYVIATEGSRLKVSSTRARR